MKTERTYEELKTRLDILSGNAEKMKAEQTREEKKNSAAYNVAFWETMHTGLPKNILKKGSDGSGGYLVPDTYDDRLVKAMSDKLVLRKLGKTIQTTQKIHIPISYGIDGANWIDAGEATSFSDVKFDEVVIDAHKLAVSIVASDEMLTDSSIDLEKYIEDMFVESIGNAEEEAFIRGNGKNKPLGIIYQAPVGKVTSIKGSINADDLVDLMYSVRKIHREKAVWVVSDDAYCKLRQIRNFNGKPIWSECIEDGEPALLLGYPIYVCKHLDNVTPDGIPVMFGDFSFFWIGDRGKRVIKRLSERYAEYGQVAFVTSERVDAKLIIPDAIKLLKVKSED